MAVARAEVAGEDLVEVAFILRAEAPGSSASACKDLGGGFHLGFGD